MSLSKIEVMNELYNAELVTLEAVATSMVSKKLVKDDLGVTGSTQMMWYTTVPTVANLIWENSRYLRKESFVAEKDIFINMTCQIRHTY